MIRLLLLLLVAVLSCFGLMSMADSLGSPTHEVTRHNDDGSIACIINYDSNDRPHGRSEWFFPDGSICTEGEFNHGSWIWIKSYDQAGRIVRNNDEFITYRPDGSIVSNNLNLTAAQQAELDRKIERQRQRIASTD